MMHFFRSVALIFSLVLSACSGDRSRPETMNVQAALADIAFSQAGLLEQEIDLLVRFSNPNPFDIETHGLRFDMTLGGAEFARGMTNESVNLTALSDTSVPIKVRVATADLVDKLIAIGSGEALTYAFDGNFFLDGSTSQDIDMLPFDGSATVRLPDIDRFLERFGAITQ